VPELQQLTASLKIYTTFTGATFVRRYRSRYTDMYKRTFRKADQTHRFVITNTDGSGWEVREEQDSQVIWRVRYTDWHRVERARMNFAAHAVSLEMSGWKES
jgi:hypothetical protein